MSGVNPVGRFRALRFQAVDAVGNPDFNESTSPDELVLVFDTGTGNLYLNVNGVWRVLDAGTGTTPFQEDFAGNISEVNPASRLTLGAPTTPTTGEKLFVLADTDPGAGSATLTVKGMAGQLGDMWRVENAADDPLATIDANGAAFLADTLDTGSDITSGGGVSAGSDITTTADVTAGGSVVATVNVIGATVASNVGNVSSAQSVTATADVTAGGKIQQDEAFQKFVQIGTLDAFARRQIWHTETSSVMRLGADTADGDAFDSDSEGIVVYHPTGDQLGRIKADRVGLTRASDSSKYYFRADETALFYRADPPGGGVWFNVDRGSGLISAAGNLEVAGYGQFGTTPDLGAFGLVRVGKNYTGPTGANLGILAQLEQTGGDDTGGFPVAGFFRVSTHGASTFAGGFAVEAVSAHGGTGPVALTMNAFSVFFGANLQVGAVAIGAIGTMQGIDGTPNISGNPGSTASAVACTTYRVRNPGSDATHTIGTARGILVDNQGGTGTTAAIGCDLADTLGASTINLSLRSAGSNAYPWKTPAALTGNTNNYAIGTGEQFRISATGAFDLTGIVAGVDGQRLVLRNVGGNVITLRNESASSAAANRFVLAGGADRLLGQNGSVILSYDAVSLRWVQVST